MISYKMVAPLLGVVGIGQVCADDVAEWQSLFNGKDLSGWTALIGKVAPGEIPPGHVEVRDSSIHMYADLPAGQEVRFGTLYHDKVLSRFHLSLEYRWGKKQFSPRAQGLKDAGLLYHMDEKPRSVFDVWPTSMECQIQEGDTGDIMSINTSALTWMNPEPEKAAKGQGAAGLLPEDGGVPNLTGKGKYIGRFPEEDKREGWNTVEAIVEADGSAVHKINGVVRARLALMKGADGKPLKSGKIGIQLEGAEILYRNIRVRELTEPLRVAAPYASMSTVKGISIGEAKIEVSNPGKDPVSLSMRLIGKDAASFRIERMNALPPLVVVQENADTATYRIEDDEVLAGKKVISYRVRFLPSGKAGRYSAGLQIGDEDHGTFLVLQGVATDALEGENEPPLQRIVEALGMPLDVGGTRLTHSTEAETIGASKPAKHFRKAEDGPVRLTPVARYSPPGNYVFGWQSGRETHEAGALADSKVLADAHQRLFPPLASGASSVVISPGEEEFGLFIRAGKRTVGTDSESFPNPLKNPSRVYPISVFQGEPIRDALLVCFEEASNGDYQDSVFLMENVRVAE